MLVLQCLRPLMHAGVVSRKRRDRALQISILCVAITAIATIARTAFVAIPGRNTVKAGALTGLTLVYIVGKKIFAATEHMAPADVLAKSRGPWDKSKGAETSRKGGHEDLLMTQRMNQRGYGAEGQEGGEEK